jgi:hypothetical protein
MYPRIPTLEARLPRLHDRLRFRLRSIFSLTIGCSVVMALVRAAHISPRAANTIVIGLALLLAAAWAALIGWIVYLAARTAD